MTIFFTIVFTLALFALPVGLIWPRLFGAGRGRALGISLSAMAIGFIGVGVTAPAPQRGEVQAEPTAQARPTPAPAVQPAPPAHPTPEARPAPAAQSAAAAARPRGPITLTATDGQSIIVWRDGPSLREGYRLLDAGINRTRPEMVMPLIACMVPRDTQIIVNDGGFATSTILVVDGRHAGCRGDVDNVHIVRPR